MINNILFVCIGNICRSPIAEYLLKAKAREVGMPLNISSAGLKALSGKPADGKAQALLDAKNIDMSNHIARQITFDMVNDANLILVMTTPLKKQLERQYNHAKGKIFRLGHHEGIDIIDPYKRPDIIFEQALVEIEQCLLTWNPVIGL